MTLTDDEDDFRNADVNQAELNVRFGSILLKNYSGKEALALWRSMCRFGLAAFGA
jgi:hypothetical protein